MPSEIFEVESKDGVAISVLKEGAGPALLLVHGAGLDAATAWSRVLPLLSSHFSVYAINRRGRPPSDDAAEYSIADEAGDLASVVAAIGQPLTLVSHSYGAIISLLAVPALPGISRLILYEPPVFEKPRQKDIARIHHDLAAALAANDNEQIASVFYRDQVGAPPEVLAQTKASSMWPKFVEFAATLPRESYVVNTLRLPAQQLAAIKVPTAMLMGSLTQGEMRAGAQWVCNSIPGCRLVLLEGQGHAATLSAPELFVSAILRLTTPAAALNQA